MKNNINTIDKIIRLVICIIFATLAIKIYPEDHSLGIIFAFLSIYLLLTILIGICPVYLFLDINTRTDKKRKRFY